MAALGRLKSSNQAPLETSSRILGPDKLQDLRLAGWAGLLHCWLGWWLTGWIAGWAAGLLAAGLLALLAGLLVW